MSTANMPAGAGPAATEAQKCEGPRYHPRADANRNTTDSADSAQPDQPTQADEALRRKARDTLIARAALAGVELVRLADGSWIVSRWGLVRPLANDADVEAWLQRVGAPG